MPEPGKDPSKTIEEGHLHFALDGERMKGEWVMFRLKPRPGEKAEPWMLKKVDRRFRQARGGRRVGRGMRDQRHHRPDHGRDRRRGPTSGRSNRGGRKGGRAKRKAGVGPPQFQAPQLATLVDAVPTGSGLAARI